MGIRNEQGRGRKDANHAAIVADYESTFCSVFSLAGCGFGAPDLLIGCSGRTELVEIKTDDGKLSVGQVDFARNWRGSKIVVVRTRDDVLKHVAAIRARVIRQSARDPGDDLPF